MTDAANTRKLYPEVDVAGGLSRALQPLLDALPGGLAADSLDKPLIAYARVKRGRRSSQVMLAAAHRAFSADFWHQGVQFGSGWAGSLSEVAHAIHAFQIGNLSAAELRAAFAWVNVTEQAFLHEAGAARFVESAWQETVEWLKKEPLDSPMRRLVPLVEACMARPLLRGLLPFTSHAQLCFSRTTGYPYTDDCPTAVWSEVDRAFRMGEPRGEGRREVVGSAEDVAAAIESALPVGCGPAVHGTAEDPS